MATLATLVVRLVGDISGFSNSMDQAGAKLRQAGSAMTSAGAGMTAGLTLPLVGVGVAAINAAAEFESSMNLLQAVSGATAEEMGAVSDTALALGADLSLPGTSAADAAAAMVELSKAGLSVQESMDAARGVLQLSAAAEIDNATAATITAQALNAFGLAGSEAATVANLLAGGANASAAEITDMAAALQMSSAVAASMGVPIADVTTAIAQMANAGIIGSDAGTSLKTMLMRLGAPTAEAAALMQSLGISIFDAQGTMLPMEALIGQFSGALGGMTMEQRNAALATIFGADAIRAANVVLMGGTEAWNQMSSAVTAEGQAQDLAATKMSGFSGALEGLKSTMETVLLVIGTPFLEMLSGWAAKLSELVGRLAEADPGLIKIGVAIGVLVAAIGPLLMVMGGMATGLGVAATAVGALLSPVGLVIVAVGLLAAAVVEHFGGVQETIAAARTFIEGILQGLSTFIDANQAQITGWIRSAWERIRGIVETVTSAVQSIISTVFGAISAFVNSHGAEISAFVSSAWSTIGQIVDLALQLIDATVVRVLTAVATFLRTHGAEIQAVLETAWNLIRGIIETVLALIKGVIQTALAIVKGDWGTAWNTIKTTTETVWTGIKGIIETLLTAIWGIVQRLGGSIKQFLIEAWNNIKARAVERFNELKTAVLNALGDLVGGMFEKGAGMVSALADGIMSRLRSALDAARRLAQELRDLLPGSDAKTGPLSDLTAAGAALPQTLATAIGDNSRMAVSATTAMVGGLEISGAPMGRAVGLSFVEAMIKAIQSRQPMVQALMSGLEISGAPMGRIVGLSFVEAMIKAIQSRQPMVQAALAQMGAAMTQAPGGVGGENAAVGAGPGRPAAATVNMYGPWNVRNEADIEAIGAAVARWLSGQTAVARRV